MIQRIKKISLSDMGNIKNFEIHPMNVLDGSSLQEKFFELSEFGTKNFPITKLSEDLLKYCYYIPKGTDERIQLTMNAVESFIENPKVLIALCNAVFEYQNDFFPDCEISQESKNTVGK